MFKKTPVSLRIVVALRPCTHLGQGMAGAHPEVGMQPEVGTAPGQVEGIVQHPVDMPQGVDTEGDIVLAEGDNVLAEGDIVLAEGDIVLAEVDNLF